MGTRVSTLGYLPGKVRALVLGCHVVPALAPAAGSLIMTPLEQMQCSSGHYYPRAYIYIYELVLR